MLTRSRISHFALRSGLALGCALAAAGCSVSGAPPAPPESTVTTGERVLVASAAVQAPNTNGSVSDSDAIGRELAVPVHLQDGDELTMAPVALAAFGQTLFTARWTTQEGQGRPLGSGTGNAGMPLADPTSPRFFPHNFNRISGPVAGSCSGCHNRPAPGGGGDIVGNVFVAGNRFDFVTFDVGDTKPLRGAVDERGSFVTFQNIADSRKTIGMFGSGFIEMLARQITADLQSEATACAQGSSCPLSSKGISFGALSRNARGAWDVSRVVGLPAQSLITSGTAPPTLIVQPFFQSGADISLRQFSINSLVRLHGIQAEERFGVGIDDDGDGFVNEVTRADVTALTIFQATLAPPGRVIPRDPAVRQAIARGERLFRSIGCAACHVPALPLTNRGWIYSEPNPYNPPGNLRPSDGVPDVNVDLTSTELPPPRLRVTGGAVMVPAYTDLKLHDITTGLPSCAAHPDLIRSHGCDGDVEALDQNQPNGSPGFFAGNGKFLTRKLWGIANQHAFGHHGQYTTMRESVLAHHGEAAASGAAFRALAASGQDAIIEFLKSLQILPPGTPCPVVDEDFRCE
jgi:cytochrome c peroxidase